MIELCSVLFPDLILSPWLGLLYPFPGPGGKELLRTWHAEACLGQRHWAPFHKASCKPPFQTCHPAALLLQLSSDVFLFSTQVLSSYLFKRELRLAGLWLLIKTGILFTQLHYLFVLPG